MHPFYGPSSVLLQGGSPQWLGLLSMVIYLLFWAVVIFIAFRWLKRQTADRDPFQKDPALIILRERYAKGAIDRQEFLEKQTDLNARGADPAGSKAGSKSDIKREQNIQSEPGSSDPAHKTGGVS